MLTQLSEGLDLDAKSALRGSVLRANSQVSGKNWWEWVFIGSLVSLVSPSKS